MPDDPATIEQGIRRRERAGTPEARVARAIVLEAGSRWSDRLRAALSSAHPSGGSDVAAARWSVETVSSVPAAAERLAAATGGVLLVASGDWTEGGATELRRAENGATARVVWIGEREAGSAWPAEADAWLPAADATPERLRAICEQQLEILELRRELEQWRERFRDLYDRSLAGLYRIDGSGLVIEANETFARLLGYDSRSALLGVRLEEFVDRETEARPLRRDGQGSRPFWSRRVCLERRDGSRLWGLMNDQRLGSAAGVFEGSLIEATREHDLALELLQQEALYVEIFGAMTEPTLLLDEAGVVLACNHRAERLLDRRALELVGRSIEEGFLELVTLDGERLGLEESPLLSVLPDGAEEAPLGVKRHDGRILWLMVRSRRIPSPRGNQRGQFLVSMVDRTDLRELSRRAQRAEVESLLTQGLVHDVRNLLTAVRAAANFLELESEDAAEVRGYAEQIDRVASSANVLLTRALEVTRNRETTAVDVDLLITDLSPMLRRAARDRRLTVRTGAPGRRVKGDRVELEQILFNLLSNAREALEDDGRVILRTFVVEQEGQVPTLRIEVEDEGCGMTEEVRRRAFEPLFTSRRDRGGGGLGLFNVALITREMGGRISFESEVGKGTIARLDLPILEAAE
jgi:PAS domain S-box-containing protein